MSFKTVALALLAATVVVYADNPAPTSNSTLTTCASIAAKISSTSAVFYPGTQQYNADISHSTNSSSQVSVCSVEPGTAADVGIVLTILGKTRTPFAVKGGGHAYHQKFSSTTGVQISMTRFNNVVYDTKAKTATLGAGLVWDDVYKALETYGVNAAGGRIRGIGVAGFTLGGGYSWFTNQYGLAIDAVTAYELVTPDGKVRTITASSSPDLFFALKGGYNNFGVVTKFTFKTFSQGQVWGGTAAYIGALYADSLTAAAAKFAATVKDPKAALLFNYGYQSGTFIISALFFYDGPTPPSGIFDTFTFTPSIFSDVGTKSFTQFFGNLPDVTEVRGVHGTVPAVEYTIDLLKALQNQTEYWGARIAAIDPNATISYSAEPFLSSILSHGNNSAYPPRRDVAYLPTSIDYSWTLHTVDGAVKAAIEQSTIALTKQTLSLGQDITKATPYGNYAYNKTTNAVVFGSSLRRLQNIKDTIDPNNVMDLTGGWKV